MTSHPKHGGLQVLFVTGEINESDDFGAALADLDPVEGAVVGLVDDVALRVEAEYVVADRRRPPGLGLVLVPKEALAGEAAAVVEGSVREDAQQRRFPGVHVSHDCHSTIRQKIN